MPVTGTIGNIRLCPLRKLGNLGPDRREIHDGFNLNKKGKTNYSAFWGHDASLVITLAQSPNRYLTPLAKAKGRRNLRKVEDL